jgi:hypothetical protein
MDPTTMSNFKIPEDLDKQRSEIFESFQLNLNPAPTPTKGAKINIFEKMNTEFFRALAPMMEMCKNSPYQTRFEGLIYSLRLYSGLFSLALYKIIESSSIISEKNFTQVV